jgi:hypothetical protein
MMMIDYFNILFKSINYKVNSQNYSHGKYRNQKYQLCFKNKKDINLYQILYNK